MVYTDIFKAQDHCKVTEAGKKQAREFFRLTDVNTAAQACNKGSNPLQEDPTARFQQDHSQFTVMKRLQHSPEKYFCT